ncbi:MAG: VacJ family lipoprotein, partial [Sphingomonadaceae bacterium]
MRAAALCFLLVLAGCATTADQRFARGADLSRASEDPWEETNRKVHNFNNAVDKAVVRPAAVAYRTATPSPLRRAVNNFYNNLNEPLNAINALAQGKITSAFRAVDRLLINTLLGFGGAADQASLMGLDVQPHDIGQTFAVWGIPSGPFVMLPVLGPSTVRDGIGLGLSILLDPIRFGTTALFNQTQSFIQLGVQVVDERAELIERGEQIRRGSADDYATVRSAWLQLRLAELYDGNPPIAEDDFDEA